MGEDSSAGGNDLDRLRDLCDGLAGTVGNGEMLAWVSAGDSGAIGDAVFTVVRDAGLLSDGDPGQPLISPASRYAGRPVSLPADGAALMSRMWEVDEPTTIGLLISLAASTNWSRGHRSYLRRRHQAEPEDVFAEMARLTGSGTRWWTNTDLSRWNPVTQHTFDAIIVGAGNGVVVTVIAFEGGG